MILVFLLIFFSIIPVLYGAQTFTIPEGTTVYGPFSTNAIHKKATYEVDRSLWTDPAITADILVEASYDKMATWTPLCRIFAEGGLPTKAGVPNVLSSECGLNTNSTHIRVTAIVKGGSIVMGKPPSANSKP